MIIHRGVGVDCGKKGRRDKGQESRVKGQGTRDKSQGSRAHRSLNLRTSELQNLKTKGQGTPLIKKC